MNAYLRGQLIGPIWNGQICTVDIGIDLHKVRTELRAEGKPARLPDILTRVIRDGSGDFQRALIEKSATILVRHCRMRGATRIESERLWPITCFRSVHHLIGKRGKRRAA